MYMVGVIRINGYLHVHNYINYMYMYIYMKLIRVLTVYMCRWGILQEDK